MKTVMKKLLSIYITLLMFSALLLSNPQLSSADTNGYCWFGPPAIGPRFSCDGDFTKESKAAKQCLPSDAAQITANTGNDVYNTQDDCKKNINAIVPPTPTEIPTPTINPNAPTQDPSKPGGSDTGGAGYTLSPTFTEIDDATDKVTITFSDLPAPAPGDNDVYLCMEGDLCIDNDSIRDGMSEGKDSSFQKARSGLTKDDVDEATIQRYRFAPGSSSMTFCGDGESKLKADGTADQYPNYKGSDGNYWSKPNRGCVPGRDFFHAGKVYVMGVYTHEPKSEKGDLWTLHQVAGIYINHHHPNITMSPLSGFTPDLTGLSVALTSDITKAPYGQYSKHYEMEYHNNYQVQITNGSYQKSICSTITKDTPPKDGVFEFKFAKNTLQPGKLTITVREQVNESNYAIEIFPKHPVDLTTDLNKAAYAVNSVIPYANLTGASFCQGGFIYRQYNCQVSKDSTLGQCTLYKPTALPDPTADPDVIVPTPIPVPYIDDPNKEDIRGLMAYFDKLGASGATSVFPCNIGSVVQNNPSKCEAVDTAIGNIPIDPLGFIMKLFTIGLSVAGIGALILIIVSGYRILMSRGNPDTIKSARETLTSAIVGLIFLIFSIVILSVIAGDILKIPGFTP